MEASCVSSAAMTRPLPVSGRVAWWGTAWLRGEAAPDDVIDAIQRASCRTP